MTPQEQAAYRELGNRLSRLSCLVATINSDCRDADRRVIADETELRRRILHELGEFFRWSGIDCPRCRSTSPQPRA